jgi:hypothetical protein|tara:strand:- start:155 stop:334 length:180 start_codon:yes stop_codon:yes gene_type:complete
MKEEFTKLKEIVKSIDEDIEKFYEKGNKSAGVRARVGLQDIKKIAQGIRLDISQLRKSL